MARTGADARRWMGEGTRIFDTALDELGDDQLAEPSLLRGWTRGHLLAHVAGNADALRNLVHWAATGEETPMYSSPEQRNEDIEAGSTKSAGALRQWHASSAAALADDMDALTDEHWAQEVLTAQGRTVPATETPWMRAREVMVHAVDLGTHVGFAELPRDFCAALLDDIVDKRSTKESHPALVVGDSDGDGEWSVAGTGEPVTVTGPLSQLTAYLAGRPFCGGGEPPTLPAWLQVHDFAGPSPRRPLPTLGLPFPTTQLSFSTTSVVVLDHESCRRAVDNDNSSGVVRGAVVRSESDPGLLGLPYGPVA